MEDEAQKMICSTTADQKEVSGGDHVAMNQEGLKKDDASMNGGGTGSDCLTTDQKEVSGGDDEVVINLGSAKMEEDHQKESGDDDVALSDSSTTDQKEVKKDDAAMNPGGAKMEEGHQKESGDDDVALSDDEAMNEGGIGSWWEEMMKSATIGGDDAVMNKSGVQYDSLDAYISRFESSDSSRLLLASPIKRKFEWIPAETQTTSGKLYTTNLNQREDVVDAVYQLSEAYDHRRLVSIVSATGFVSDIFFLDGLNAYEISQITSLSLQYPADEDVRPCRNNAACSVSGTDYEGKTYKVTGVINYLVANGPIEITAELEEEKSAGESSAAAQDGNSDSGKAIEELEAFPKNLPAADGNINPTSTTGAANDQDKKSPSEEDI